MKKEIMKAVRSWEMKNLVWGRGYYAKKSDHGHKSLSSKLAPTGADLYRVSPGITRKFGLKYRKIYLGHFDPERETTTMGGRRVSVPKHTKAGKLIPKLRWHPYGYIKAGKTRGTFKLHNLSSWSKSHLKKMGIK